MLFKNQGYVTLSFETGLDLSAATNPKILFKRPDGTKGSFVAAISGSKLTYDMANADLNQAPGMWQFQTYFQVNGRDGYGDIVPISVEENLS